MYKLLTTAAVIMTVATPSIANEWTGHKDLVNNLKDIYTNLDGGTQFGLLEGEYKANGTGTGYNGQLSNFFSTVDQGVTYITLDVDQTTHQISTGINEGKTFDEIKESADDLVNRVNYDLFVAVDTTGDGYVTYDPDGTNYDNPTNHDIIGTPDSGNTGDNGYSSNVGGLLGAKVNELTTAVDGVNDFLLGTGLSNDQRTDFIDYWNGVDGATSEQSGAVDGINANIANLNTVIDLASDGNNFFGNTNLGALTEGTVNNFVIPSFNSFDDIGNAGDGGFNSISDWASGQQTVTVDGTDYHFQGTDTITVDGTNVTVGTEPAQAIGDDARFVAVP